jgi:putative copper resistance protein D
VTAADGAPPFSAAALLRGWTPDPLVIVPMIVIGALYLIGFLRLRRQSGPVISTGRGWAFAASLIVLFLADNGPFHTYSQVDLAVHMAKHMVLLMVVPPLFVLGSPVTLALRTAPAGVRSRFLDPLLRSRVTVALTRPWVAGGLYAVVLVATHFTGFYSLALENHFLHDLEHLSYLAVGLLVSGVIFGVGTGELAASFPYRIFIVVLLMPVMSVISLVFIVANHPLYQYYVTLPRPWGGRSQALANQAIAGAVMWIPSGLLTMATVIYITVEWFRKEEAQQNLIEAIEDARQRPVG